MCTRWDQPKSHSTPPRFLDGDRPVIPTIQFARRFVRFFLERPDDTGRMTYALWQRLFMRRRLGLGMLLAFGYFATYAALDWVRAWVLPTSSVDAQAVMNLLTAVVLAGLLVWLQRSPRHSNLSLMFLTLSWAVSVLTEIPETLSGHINPDISGWTMLFFAQATVIPFRWRLHLVSHLGAYAYYFGVNGLLGLPLFPEGTAAADVLFDMVWISGMSVLVVYLIDQLFHTEFVIRRQLDDERSRSQALLLNILPQSVAERLLRNQRTVADNFSTVTVLFADIVDFTQLSAHMTPDQIVELLNTVFSMFDELVEEFALEKIKTIGDAYMVVAGVPHYREDHAVAIANMALAMQDALEKFSFYFGRPILLRIGIHTGPVVAGVIGLKKFAYDLWGDTVNTASRMESQGLPNEIQVTDTTYECLKYQFVFEERGQILVKGKGEMVTYLLKGKK
ncbi:adenylate/guanylate cyclase domain-containing protein [Leptolyngbya sp. FACHB-8]|uniref:adenylate/guanylate cyclase domain-containing protein n=1 Tax=unclassified Leptolyngbya TaxID=2650499 RepID=UPI001688F6BC|nr:adenylate/guanylate cyclase domain-containing protein [Leptolyngbya sp. FACHB-8]